MESTHTAIHVSLPWSAIIRRTWRDYTSRWSTYMGISLIAAIIIVALTTLLAVTAPNVLHPGLAAFFGIVLIIIVLGAEAWAFAALVHSMMHQDTPPSIIGAYKAVIPKLLGFWKTFILSVIFMIIGFILLIIPGIIVSVFFTFGIYIVMDEGLTGMAALKQSYRYVKGNGWGVFFASLAIALITGFTSIVPTLLLAPVVQDPFVRDLPSNILGVIILPLIIGFFYQLYLEIKARKSEPTTSVPV